ncbi:ABC transporter permease [Pyrococcus furiosus DSM 3638]|uniref:ABC transporter permease n=3 Tax=Pyrococcus furiosus TaxID=2261 RepID=A0A5C0XQA0_PYRFU|nr:MULTISPECIES: ABC transporter permease [Pyrococcus]AAL81335.1 dipeptide ABC transporter, permease protein [Pyrococcus furiosus DSM 3638]AFN04000.1 dipeptide ABC transporter permease [Pyrococcus furiosus COM1]MDK2870446.1 peptide/nickel transport system permease protein [Pyrococcus sp.]QEK78861.1 ABC transporter permease [Pyrococcus furiosus DSM 3638]
MPVGKSKFEVLKIALKNIKFKVGLGIVIFFALFAIIGPLLVPFDNMGYYPIKVGDRVIPKPTEPALPPGSLSKVFTPNGTVEVKHYLGTDSFGRDVYAQLTYGLRSSLIVGLLAGSIATAIGLLIGFIAGYKGGLVDEILMMITNIMLVIPTMALLIIIAAYLPYRGIGIESVIIGLTAWPWTARAVRAQTLSLKRREFVDLSKLSGQSDLQIIFGEILPNMVSYVFMVFILQFSGAILAAVGLDFLGLGPTKGMSLGIMLQMAVLWNAINLGYWWWAIPPGLVIAILITGLYMINLGLEEVFNPRLRRE